MIRFIAVRDNRDNRIRVGFREHVRGWINGLSFPQLSSFGVEAKVILHMDVNDIRSLREQRAYRSFLSESFELSFQIRKNGAKSVLEYRHRPQISLQ